jgi:hypothetical protein
MTMRIRIALDFGKRRPKGHAMRLSNSDQPREDRYKPTRSLGQTTMRQNLAEWIVEQRFTRRPWWLGPDSAR